MGAFRNEALEFNGNLYLPLAGGTMSGSIGVAIDNTIDLGAAAGGGWRAVYAYAVDSPGVLKLGGTVASSVELGKAGQTLQAKTSLTPVLDNSIDVGAGLLAWRALYGYALTSPGALAIDGSGAIDVGQTNATSVGIGRAAITTTVRGKLRYDNAGGAVGTSTGTSLIVNVGGVDLKLQLFNI